MGDVRRLMARLSPAAVKFNTGRGGIPELTPQDIAGAIGIASRTLGRNAELSLGVFCAAWWPDSKAGNPARVAMLIEKRLLIEAHRRVLAADDAELTHLIAQAELQAALSALTPAERLVRPPNVVQVERAVQRRKAEADIARGICWPRPKLSDAPSIYHRIARAALDECCRPGLCPDCDGIGYLQTETGPKPCEKCNTRGIIPRSARARAEACGLSKNGYTGAWDEAFDWAVQLASEAESQAAAALRKALFERVEA